MRSLLLALFGRLLLGASPNLLPSMLLLGSFLLMSAQLFWHKYEKKDSQLRCERLLLRKQAANKQIFSLGFLFSIRLF